MSQNGINMLINRLLFLLLFILISCQDIEYSKRSRYSISNKSYRMSYNSDDYLLRNKTYTGYFKVGTSYKIDGKTYYPKEYNRYNETGLASWYGDDFHNKKTANGEIFNMNEMTAAHKTLPLPSIVRVTNLENGLSVIVRVNDRGPFVDNRIIDMSKYAADKLGFKNKGVIKVRVELLKKETEKFLQLHNLR